MEPRSVRDMLDERLESIIGGYVKGSVGFNHDYYKALQITFEVRHLLGYREINPLSDSGVHVLGTARQDGMRWFTVYANIELDDNMQCMSLE
ncbi:MAG: hypothetical protein MPJ05_01585 [Nitrosopumilus sp.]|nr:hypothetical protein [Nitrosopumilus sp.]